MVLNSDVMRSPRWEGLRKSHERRLKPPYPTLCFGDPIGTLDSGEECWEVAGDLRKQYHTEIHPKLYERLLAIFGTASISDWISLPVYMVGQHCTDAVPTVMVCSEDENACKQAKKEIKKSGLLKGHAKFKIMCVTEDPGMRNMEQLASDANKREIGPAATRGMNVLVDRSKPLQPLGMEVWVDHGSSLRPTTAFMSRVNGHILLRTVQHAFASAASPAKPAGTTRRAAVHVYSDSDSDSESEPDSESDDEDELDIAITSIGSKSPDTWSDSGSYSGNSSVLSVSSGKSTPSIDHFTHSNSTVSSNLREVSSRLVPLASLPGTYPPKQIAQPSRDTLISLGKLAFWSVDKDWALIEITNEELKLALERPTADHTMSPKPLPGLKDDAEVIAYTSSGGTLTGKFSGTPFCTRLPNSTSFQDVYRVRLSGALANGDCGSAVWNAVTGELYGHIVAGCRAMGTAYIMAAHQVEADFERLVTKGVPGPNCMPNKAHVLVVEPIDAKEENQDTLVNRHQSTPTESQPQKLVKGPMTSVPVPEENDIIHEYDKLTSNPFVTQGKGAPQLTKRKSTEYPDIHGIGIAILYSSQIGFAWLLSHLQCACTGVYFYEIGIGVLASNLEPQLRVGSLMSYSFLLGITIPHLISVRFGRGFNIAFATMKLGVLVVICVMALLVLPPDDATSSATDGVRISDSLRERMFVRFRRIVIFVHQAFFYFPIGLATTRAWIASEKEGETLPSRDLRTFHRDYIAAHGLLGAILFYRAGHLLSSLDHLWQYLWRLDLHLAAIAGTLLLFVVLHYALKRRKKARPKRVTGTYTLPSRLQSTLFIAVVISLVSFSTRWKDIPWSTSISWAAIQFRQLCRDLFYEADISRNPVALTLVLWVAPGLGFITQFFFVIGLSFKTWLAAAATLAIIFQVGPWSYNLLTTEQIWRMLPTQSYGVS